METSLIYFIKNGFYPEQPNDLREVILMNNWPLIEQIMEERGLTWNIVEMPIIYVQMAKEMVLKIVIFIEKIVAMNTELDYRRILFPIARFLISLHDDICFPCLNSNYQLKDQLVMNIHQSMFKILVQIRTKFLLIQVFPSYLNLFLKVLFHWIVCPLDLGEFNHYKELFSIKCLQILSGLISNHINQIILLEMIPHQDWYNVLGKCLDIMDPTRRYKCKGAAIDLIWFMACKKYFQLENILNGLPLFINWLIEAIEIGHENSQIYPATDGECFSSSTIQKSIRMLSAILEKTTNYRLLKNSVDALAKFILHECLNQEQRSFLNQILTNVMNHTN